MDKRKGTQFLFFQAQVARCGVSHSNSTISKKYHVGVLELYLQTRFRSSTG